MPRSGDIFPVVDPVKKSLFIPKLLLEATNFWPEKQTILTKTTNWVMLAICVFIESGQIAFVIINSKDITKIASAMSTVSTTFQAISKLSVLYFYSPKLSKVLNLVWYQFWPANIGGENIAKYLEIYNRIIIAGSVIMFISGILFAFGFLSSPLISGNRVLPFEAIYPFNCNQSPLYEIIYVGEWMTNIAFILVGICGHDYLFIGLCSNIVGQFILLKEIFSNFGTNKVRDINIILTTYSNVEENDEDLKFLKLCIKHHSMLTHVAKEVAEIFSFSSFVQLLSSVTALCVAALLMTFAEVNESLFVIVGAYIFGHLLQLFLFCTIGNELISHADNFAKSIFSTEWYNIDNINVKKDMILVIRRAQKDVKMSALGVKVLDFQTFIGVLRLSFSFYTMLSKITDY